MERVTDNKYNFPDYYNWPFFYTIQRHAETRLKQLNMWCELIVGFCRANKIWRLSKTFFIECIGKNSNINRKLNNDSANIIFDCMNKLGYGAYINKSTDEMFLLWRSLKEWEEYFYDTAIKFHKMDTLETLDFLIADDDNENEEYFGMDKELLIIILKGLENKKKCILLTDDSNKYIGVKFLK